MLLVSSNVEEEVKVKPQVANYPTQPFFSVARETLEGYQRAIMGSMSVEQVSCLVELLIKKISLRS